MQKVIQNNTKNLILTENKNNIIFIFSDTKNTFDIHLRNHSYNNLTFIGDNCNIKINIYCENQTGESEIYGIFGTKDKKSSVDIQTIIQTNDCKTNKHLINIVGNNGDTNISGNVFIKKGQKKVEGHLLEENIIIGENTKVKALPMLDIHTNDVIASHGVRIEKLNKQKLFYLQSKGITERGAQLLIIESYINKALQNIQDTKEAKKIKEKFITRIL